MMSENKETRDVFLAVLALSSAEEQSHYLDQACRDKPELRQRVERLLREHQQVGSFLENPVPPPTKSTLLLTEPPTQKPGDRIGPYKLLQQIGEGGCGVVYMAEQAEPIRRRVALKVIKLGMDTKQVIARFEAERQALALMDHPNIAKVLDAGTTECGRPYFVMELVRGVKITDYCDENRLPIPERLNLFVQVCYAIQHAHQKGVIHRDIKPSNILVSLNDGLRVPKVIDFGIAKAIGQQLTDKTVVTAFEQFIGTPAYMSPEQAGMTSLDVDTRSDIYALGVLLYELLTGHTPFDQKELVAAGLDAMRRIIREQEPARPSTRLSTLADPERTAVARRHHADPPELIHLLRGDLDWIVMKSLEKDRTRRYETANGLTNDVVRYLNDEAVSARPPSRLYRFQKLVRRNKLVFAAGAAVAGALVLGLSLSTWFFFSERAARQRAVAAEKKAQTEANKSQQVAQFLQDMLRGVGPSVALGQDTAMLRGILDKTAERVGKDLKDSPEVEAELRTTLGQMYQALGQFTKAEEMHRAALVIRRGLWGNMNTKVADSLGNLVEALEWQTRPAEAQPLALEALTIRTNLLGAEHPKVAESLAALGVVRLAQGKYTEAEELHRHALAMRRKLVGNESLEVADSLVDLGGVLISQGRYPEAEAAALEAVAIQKRLLGQEYPDPNLGASQILLGRVLHDEGKEDEAETTLRPILAMRRKLVGSESLLVAYPSLWLAVVLGAEGKLDEAEQLGREALATYRKLKASSTSQGAIEIAWCLNILGNVLHRKGSLPEAEALFRELYECSSTSLKTESQFLMLNLGWGGGGLVTVLREERKLDQAETLCREAVASQRKLLASSDDISRSQQLAPLLCDFGEVLHAEGKLAEAEAVLREAIESAKKSPASESQAIALVYLGVVLHDQGKPAEAEPLYHEAEEIGRKLPASTSKVFALARLGDLLRDAGKPAEAEPLYREGLDTCLQVSPSNFERRQWLTSGLASILRSQGKLPEAEALCRETLEAGRKLPPSSARAHALAALADLLRDQGKMAEAEPLYREGLEICRKVLPDDFESRQWLAVGLAVALRSQGKLAEAEPLYREAVTNAAKVWPNDPARWQWQVNDLADVLRSQGKSDEAEQLLAEVLKPASLAQPQNAITLRTRADLSGRHGQWKEAAADLNKLLEADSSDPYAQLQLAAVLAQAGDKDAYRVHCRKMLARFGGTNDPATLDKTAKACLLVPCTGPDLETACQLAQKALTLATSNAWVYFFEFGDGLAKYRQGQYVSASALMQKVIGRPGSVRGSMQAWEFDVAAYSLLAAAQHQLNQTNEARTALAKASELAQTRLPQLASGDLGHDWVDWLIAHVFLREAQALITGETSPTESLNPDVIKRSLPLLSTSNADVSKKRS